MSFFEKLKSSLLNVVENTMGDDALWYKDADTNSSPISAKVFYNDPSRAEKVGGHEFAFGRATVEYKSSDWTGLKELSDAKSTQLIYVEGRFFYVYKITSQNGYASTSKDGDTYVAILEEAQDL